MVTALQALVHNEAAASIVGTLLAVTLAVLALDGPRWDRKIRSRLAEREVCDRLDTEFYGHRPGPALYEFVPALALGEDLSSRRERMAARAVSVAVLSHEQRDVGVEMALQWIATVGAFARSAAEEESISLRRFLQTHHLGIVREGSVMLPFIVYLLSRDALNEDQVYDASWGLALVELAGVYNWLARQQRQPIYFRARGDCPPYGPLSRRPPFLKFVYLRIRDRTPHALRLPAWRRRFAERSLRQWSSLTAMNIEAVGTEPPLDTSADSPAPS